MHYRYRYLAAVLLTTLISLSSFSTNAFAARKLLAPVITVTQPQLVPIDRPIEAIGTLQANQSIDITPQVDGRVIELNLQDGGSVSQNDLLIKLDSREQAAKVRETEISFKDQQRKLAYMETLYKRKAVSRDELEAQQAQVNMLDATLSAEQAKLDYYTLEAPFNGILGFNDTGLGSLISNGTVITTLDDISLMKLDIELPESVLREVTAGTPIKAYSKAWPDQEFTGTVTSINPRINAQNLTFKVRAVLDNSHHQLRPGMLMSISVLRPPKELLTIPARSVLFQGNNRYVYTINDDNMAEKRLIETNLTLGDQIAVINGLNADDVIIDQGVVKVSDGQTIQILEENMASRQGGSGENRT